MKEIIYFKNRMLLSRIYINNLPATKSPAPPPPWRLNGGPLSIDPPFKNVNPPAALGTLHPGCRISGILTKEIKG